MNREGIVGDYMLENVPRIIYLAVVMMAIVLLVNAYSNVQVDTKEIQAEVLFNRMMYSNNLLWEEDSLGNSMTGFLILEKFNDANVSTAINYDVDRYAAARLTVESRNGNVVGTAYLNKKWFERWKPLVGAGLLGRGSASEYTWRVPITYVERGEERGGILEARIIIPHS